MGCMIEVVSEPGRYVSGKEDVALSRMYMLEQRQVLFSCGRRRAAARSSSLPLFFYPVSLLHLRPVRIVQRSPEDQSGYQSTGKKG